MGIIEGAKYETNELIKCTHCGQDSDRNEWIMLIDPHVDYPISCEGSRQAPHLCPKCNNLILLPIKHHIQ